MYGWLAWSKKAGDKKTMRLADAALVAGPEVSWGWHKADRIFLVRGLDRVLDGEAVIENRRLALRYRCIRLWGRRLPAWDSLTSLGQ